MAATIYDLLPLTDISAQYFCLPENRCERISRIPTYEQSIYVRCVVRFTPRAEPQKKWLFLQLPYADARSSGSLGKPVQSYSFLASIQHQWPHLCNLAIPDIQKKTSWSISEPQAVPPQDVHCLKRIRSKQGKQTGSFSFYDLLNDPEATIIVMSDHGERRYLKNKENFHMGIYGIKRGY